MYVLYKWMWCISVKAFSEHMHLKCVCDPVVSMSEITNKGFVPLCVSVITVMALHSAVVPW